MNLNEMSKVELGLLSYTDLTAMILKENNKPMTTPAIFKKICELLGYSDEDYASKIGDYYTSLTIDKRFHLLENGEWDLSNNHIIPLEIDDDDDDLDEESEDLEEEENEEEIDEIDEEENIDSIIDDDDDLDDDINDIDDLAILDDEEELES